ncbi:hypothetical protein Ddye_010746 [Dipteronia dyeriana]|uniref:RNase H type-1 domain-containing protein n=1 Tax=Dipteronia dyeriana TaxID=168575 RepID=A0AAD9XDY6_9ROSI|nr:hypothetical protein Ddye_010746 [Dipteronia dyeriana]
MVSWRLPDTGRYKLNCDAVIGKKSCKTGIGIVIRDKLGFVLASCSQSLSANFNLDTAKTMAIYKGIIFSKDCGLTLYVLESDVEMVVKRIAEGCPMDAISGTILTSIISMLDRSEVTSISHIPK